MEKTLKKYVVLMSDKYLRDTQLIDTVDIPDDEFENMDVSASQYDHLWKDYCESLFVGVVKAKNEKEAVDIAACFSKDRKYCLYDPRCLCAIEV